MQLVGVDDMKLMRCEAANVKCLVAWGQGRLLLAFRGTANLTNALADIKVSFLCDTDLAHTSEHMCTRPTSV